MRFDLGTSQQNTLTAALTSSRLLDSSAVSVSDCKARGLEIKSHSTRGFHKTSLEKKSFVRNKIVQKIIHIILYVGLFR